MAPAFAGQGRTWAVYHAYQRLPPDHCADGSSCGNLALSRADSPAQTWVSYCPLVLKVVDPGEYISDRSYSEDSSSASGPDARDRALNEIQVLTGPLKHLQGIAVPRVLHVSGCDDTGDDVIVLMEEVGPPVASEWHLIPPDTVELIRQLYKTVHGAGVAQGEVELRHIRYANHETRSELRLIDFDGAIWSGTASEAKLRFDIHREGNTVRYLLKWNGVW